MSSNAFASSRPRVRHQRVPRTRSCDHPRFMQLVNEIARINEAKKKQEEVDRGLNTNQPEQRNNPPPPSVNACATGIGSNNCCNPTAPQTSYGYRSLEPINQSSSALHDNYHQAHQQQQPSHNNNNNNHHHHHHHHNHHHTTHSQLQQHQTYQNTQQQFSNNNVLHQEERCPAKTSASFGFSKQNVVVEQNDSDFADNNPGLAQDENRSKRKRSTIDYSANNRKSSSSSGASGASKRHKSSDAARPLSPSFTKCPICLLDCMDRDPSFTNTCFHLFCYVCIESWSKNKATCPLCRTKFTKIIYNIKSATSFAEKVTSPIRRDDDDVYIADRHYMLEHLSNLNSNSSVPSRNNNGEDVQFLFENLRNPEVLMPQYFVNQMDHRPGESLHSFNTVTSLANFNPNVPPNPLFAPSYPITTNYAITLSFPQGRIAPTSAAIASAYTANSSLTDLINDPNSRRISRSGRYIYSRNYERPTVDSHARVSRTTTSNTAIDRTSLPLERLHHHQPIQQHPHQHQDHHHQHHSLQHHQHHQGPPQQQQQPQHHQQHQSNQSRSIETIDMSQRQSHRVEQGHNNIQLPYTVQPRHYGPNVYVRRPYNSNHQVEQQHILDTLYRQMPDM